MIGKRARFGLLVVGLALAGCTKGDECDKCTTDSDCRESFVCTTFDDGSQRCGSGLGATQCRVR